jgi:hypothetical protein
MVFLLLAFHPPVSPRHRAGFKKSVKLCFTEHQAGVYTQIRKRGSAFRSGRAVYGQLGLTQSPGAAKPYELVN